jgi:hypothetical protein
VSVQLGAGADARQAARRSAPQTLAGRMAKAVGSLLEGRCARMPGYTDLKTVFEVFGGREREYDWLLTELECNFPPELQDGGAWFFSGSDLSDLVRRQDPPIQFIWAVLTGFDRGTSVDLAHLDMVPDANGNPDFWRGAPRIQYPNARVELVCFDSSLTLLITEDADLTSRFRAGFPEAVDLESFNRR